MTRFSARVWIDVAVLTVLTVIGLLGFATSFGTTSYLLAGLGGLAVGTLIALLAASLRWGILVTTLVLVGGYFLFGSFFAMPAQALLGFIPTAETLSGLAVGAVFGWADIVTLTTPVGAPDYIAVLPYIASWLVGLTSATLSARWFVARRRTPAKSALALLGPIAIYVAGVLVGTEEPYFAALRGVAFAAIGLVWMSWRIAPETSIASDASRAVARRRVLGVSTVVLAAVVVGSLLGFAAAPPNDERFVLRQYVQPPFDPLLYPSPLSGFRHYTKDVADDVLFTVSGLKSGDRLRLATMDSYDGTVWNATGPDLYADGSGAFDLVYHNTQPTSLATVGGQQSLDVTVGAYSDYWLPGIGYPKTIDFENGANLDSTSLRYNSATGIALITSRASEGMEYAMTVDTQKTIEDGALATVAAASVNLPPISNVPDIIAAKATELAGDAKTPIEKLRAIESALHSLGFLSHGAASSAVASSAGHGADRMKALFERNQWIGDEEQFASAFALMARSLGYPARVVMGFAPTIVEGQPVDVVGSDVTAWVEVAFDKVGWVPFYPTPDETDIPQDQTTVPKTEPQPQVRQPPRNDAQQDDLVSAVELEKAEDDPSDGFAIPGWVWTLATALAIPAALYFVPLLVIAHLKRRRRERRRGQGAPDRRAAGAWDELADTYAELGYSAPRKGTRLQLALGFEDQFREELAARELERVSAARRKAAQQARAEQKAAAPPEAQAASARLGSLLDATVVRAKETAAWRPGVTDDRVPLPAIPGLREFAVRADAAVFSGAEIPQSELDDLWSESTKAVDAAKLSVSWFRRQLSKFRIRSKRDLAGTLAARLTAAVPAPIRGVQAR